MVGVWGKPFPECVRSVRAGQEKMTLTVPVSLKAEAIWVSVCVLFLWGMFSILLIYFSQLNVSFGANFNQIGEVSL